MGVSYQLKALLNQAQGLVFQFRFSSSVRLRMKMELRSDAMFDYLLVFAKGKTIWAGV